MIGNFICDSEDEFALLNAARQIGFRFVRRDAQRNVYLRVFSESVKFEFVGLLPFDSDRKIMSIVVKNEQGETILFAKGADEAMISRLQAMNARKLAKIQDKVKAFAENSFRTLVMGMRKFDKKL